MNLYYPADQYSTRLTPITIYRKGLIPMELPTFQPRIKGLYIAIANLIDIWLFYICLINLQYAIWLWTQLKLDNLPEWHILTGVIALLILPVNMLTNMFNATLRFSPCDESIGQKISNNYAIEFLHSPFANQFKAKAITDDFLNPVGAYYHHIIDDCVQAKKQLKSLEESISGYRALHINRRAQKEYSDTISTAWMKIREAGETTALEMYERDQISLATQHQLIEQIATHRDRI